MLLLKTVSWLAAAPDTDDMMLCTTAEGFIKLETAVLEEDDVTKLETAVVEDGGMVA